VVVFLFVVVLIWKPNNPNYTNSIISESVFVRIKRISISIISLMYNKMNNDQVRIENAVSETKNKLRVVHNETIDMFMEELKRLREEIEGLGEMIERVEGQRDHYKMLWEVLIEKMEDDEKRNNTS